jgi:hypothetical protein
LSREPGTRGRPTLFFDWLFRSRQTGRITIAQFPNVALWIFLATVVVRRAAPLSDSGRTAVDAVALAALAWWALDEVLRGVNPWRRLLGLGGCALVVTGVVSLVR